MIAITRFKVGYRHLCVVIISLMLQGCAPSRPDVDSSPIVPIMAKGQKSQISTSPLKLKDAVRLGILSSAEVRNKNFTIEQRANEAVIARAALYPELYAQLQPTLQSDENAATAGAGIRFTLYDFGERIARIKAADAGIEKSRFDVFQSIDESVLETVDSYINVAIDTELEKVARDYLAQIDELEEDVRTRVEIGAASNVDLNDIATGQLKAKSEIITANAKVKNSRDELASLVEVTPRGIEALNSLNSYLSIDNASARMPTDLSLIPRIAALEKELDSARYLLDAEKAGILPRLGIKLGLSISPTSSGVVAGPELSEMISLGGGRRQVVRNAELEVLKAQQQWSEEVRQTRLEFAQATTQLAAAQDRIGAFKKVLKLAMSTRDVMLGEYEIGNRDLGDLVEAEERIYGAEVSYTEGQRELLKAQLSVLIATNKAAARFYKAPK